MHNPQTGERDERAAKIIPLPWVARKLRRPARRTRPQDFDSDDYIVSTRALVVIAAFLVLFIVSTVWLLETMRKNAQIEECLMAGRRNCVPISTPLPAR